MTGTNVDGRIITGAQCVDLHHIFIRRGVDELVVTKVKANMGSGLHCAGASEEDQVTGLQGVHFHRNPVLKLIRCYAV